MKGDIMKAFISVIFFVMVFSMGCARTQPQEDKVYKISPKQVVNNVTIISDKSMEMLIKLSWEDLKKAVQLLNRHSGIVLHMGAWGIKVEGIKASRTTTSEATSKQAFDTQLVK